MRFIARQQRETLNGFPTTNGIPHKLELDKAYVKHTKIHHLLLDVVNNESTRLWQRRTGAG